MDTITNRKGRAWTSILSRSFPENSCLITLNAPKPASALTGGFYSWLAPKDGVLNVWVAPREDLQATQSITHDTGRGIRFHNWAFTNQHILYIQDKNGDENWHLYAVNVNTKTVVDLTPFEGVAAQLAGLSHQYPDEVIVGLNNRNPQWHDLHRLNIHTGEMTLLLEHDRFASVEIDDDFQLRFALQMMPDGHQNIYIRHGEEWQLWDNIPQEDMLTSGLAGFDKANRKVYLQDSRGRNTAALFALDIQTKARKLLAENPWADLGEILRHPHRAHDPGCLLYVHPEKLGSGGSGCAG